LKKKSLYAITKNFFYIKKKKKIITLPYNLLIQKSSREALGLDLKDSIIIFDEVISSILYKSLISTINLINFLNVNNYY